MTEEQARHVYDKLCIERFVNENIRPIEYNADTAIGLGHGLTVSFEYEDRMLNIRFKSMNGDESADEFSDLSEECKHALEDIKTFLKTFLIDDLFESPFSMGRRTTDYTDEKPYKSTMIVPLDTETVDIQTDEYVVEINNNERKVSVPKKRVENNEVREYLESVWWRGISNENKLEAAGIDNWELDAEFFRNST